MGRKTERELRVEDGPIWQKTGRDDALLLGRWRGYDRDRSHLGAGARRRRREQERQALPFGQTNPVYVIKPILGFGEIGNQLRGIERAAAANRDHRLDPLVAAQGYRGLDHMR